MSAKGKTGDRREGERKWRRREEENGGIMEGKGKEKKNLGLHSRLGRPGRTNVFDSPEMNFPAVVTTGAKHVKPSLQSPDRSTSKADKILGKYFIWKLFEGSLTEVSQMTLCLSLADEVFNSNPLFTTIEASTWQQYYRFVHHTLIKEVADFPLFGLILWYQLRVGYFGSITFVAWTLYLSLPSNSHPGTE